MHKLKLNTDIGEITVLCKDLQLDPFIDGNVVLCGLEGLRENWRDKHYFYIVDWSVPKKDLLERSVGELVEKPIESSLDVDEFLNEISQDEDEFICPEELK